MPYQLTLEQQDILSTATSLPSGSILKIEAVAGASKTYTLTKIAELLHGSNCMYLAYNKSIATEASSVFPRYVECKTTHSLAYSPIVSYGLDMEGNVGSKREVGFFNYRSITEKIEYEDKLYIVSHLERFFLSKHTSLEQYLTESDISPESTLAKLLTKYFTAMIDKTIPCTHAFYLKMYHILLANGYIHYDRPFDLIMLDEAGDINAVTLEIFLLLPANLKVMVGDSLQNIYSFNGTINGFKALEGIGVTKHLSQSFRCSTAIADSVESFIHRHLDNTIVFTGTNHTDTTIRTEAILSRTNSGLIKYMIDLSKSNIPFNLTREAKEIFSTMLMLMNLKSTSTIYDAQYKHLIDDAKRYENSSVLRSKYKTLLMYIKSLYEDEDPNIKSAISTIVTYGASKVYEAYKYAQSCEKSKQDHKLTLSTVHSSKGLTFDMVTISDDFDLDDVIELTPSERSIEQTESLRLYYVACTRARIKLDNAVYLRR